VKPRGLIILLAILGLLGGAWACGRTSLEVFDDVGNDGGGQDATPDSARDVVVGDASVCVQNPEMSECCGFGPPTGGYSCEFDFGASICGQNGWTCPRGGSPAPACGMICMIAPDAGLTDAPSRYDGADASRMKAPDSAADAAVADTAADSPLCAKPEGDDSGTPPSCAPGGQGMTNCGPGGSGTESCCTSLEVTTVLRARHRPTIGRTRTTVTVDLGRQIRRPLALSVWTSTW
jgi:hypothetical protein